MIVSRRKKKIPPNPFPQFGGRKIKPENANTWKLNQLLSAAISGCPSSMRTTAYLIGQGPILATFIATIGAVGPWVTIDILAGAIVSSLITQMVARGRPLNQIETGHAMYVVMTTLIAMA